jgi:hypothetical protein
MGSDIATIVSFDLGAGNHYGCGIQQSSHRLNAAGLDIAGGAVG